MLATTAVVQSTQTSVATRTRSKSNPAPSPILVKSVSTSSLVITPSPNVAYCLPARKTKTTKKAASTQHPKLTKSTSTSQLSVKPSSSSSSTALTTKTTALSNSALKGWIMNLLRINNPKTTPVEALGPMSSPNIANSKPPLVPRPPTIVKQAPKPNPVPRETLVRASAFLKLCESHREFFKGCYEIDPYIISMAFNYMQRAVPLIPVEAFNTELLFFCLYLGWETEEDSTVGIEGIIHYIIGPFPSSRGKDKITRKYEIMEWKRKLNVFHTGKDKLWRALDFNTYVSQPQCLQTLQLFPADHEIFKRPRRPEDLRKFF